MRTIERLLSRTLIALVFMSGSALAQRMPAEELCPDHCNAQYQSYVRQFDQVKALQDELHDLKIKNDILNSDVASLDRSYKEQRSTLSELRRQLAAETNKQFAQRIEGQIAANQRLLDKITGELNAKFNDQKKINNQYSLQNERSLQLEEELTKNYFSYQSCIKRHCKEKQDAYKALSVVRDSIIAANSGDQRSEVVKEEAPVARTETKREETQEKVETIAPEPKAPQAPKPPKEPKAPKMQEEQETGTTDVAERNSGTSFGILLGGSYTLYKLKSKVNDEKLTIKGGAIQVGLDLKIPFFESFALGIDAIYSPYIQVSGEESMPENSITRNVTSYTYRFSAVQGALTAQYTIGRIITAAAGLNVAYLMGAKTQVYGANITTTATREYSVPYGSKEFKTIDTERELQIGLLLGIAKEIPVGSHSFTPRILATVPFTNTFKNGDVSNKLSFYTLQLVWGF